ncbi:MAG: monofunctional biosynthetic peptidoglycan transglycosylase [Gammaproteobacteria bacterium]|nr:monofunctional biosynthetic peptidoglycan transglycosylase [Gammaproteobacteria bacterium]
MYQPIRKLRRLIAWSGLIFVLVSVALVLPLRWLNPPTTAFMLKDWWASKKHPAQEWVTLKNISPQLSVAVIASEDQLFPVHYGFDLKMIADAMEESSDKRRGASTISQQVAKNLYLWSGHSYIRKGIEAWFTVLIETLWPKERILEVYLNIAEFGRGIYGVGAASRRLFGKKPSRLNRYEASLLAAVLPNPKWRKANKPSDYVRQRAIEIMLAIRELGGVAYLQQI